MAGKAKSFEVVELGAVILRDTLKTCCLGELPFLCFSRAREGGGGDASWLRAPQLFSLSLLGRQPAFSLVEVPSSWRSLSVSGGVLWGESRGWNAHPQMLGDCSRMVVSTSSH